MTRQDRHYRYPWRADNQVELLVDGENFFPAMLQALAQARRYVLLEFYLFESGRLSQRFIHALCHTAERGVGVYLLLDDFGARRLSASERQRLQRANIHLAWYNPLRYGKWRRNLFRDHRKLLLIDGILGFTGGAGIADEFDTSGKPLGWHEVMVAFRGPVLADWQHLFTENWQRLSDTPLPALPVPEHCHRQSQQARLTINAPGQMGVKRSLLRQLQQAQRRIWIATAYFIPSWKIRRRLRRAARRGVDVRLLLPGPHTDHPAVRHAGRRYYAGLLRQGVRIYEYQPRFIHAKLQLCDDWVSVGSSNIDRWNLRWNLEANLEVEGEPLASQMVALFEQDFAQSAEIHYQDWQVRPWYRRLQERGWGWVDRWLERFSQRS